MKKSILFAFALLAATNAKPNDATAHTYYTIRSHFQSARPERISLWRYDAAKERDCGWCGSFEVVPFGGQSTRPKDLAKYFMFCGKSELVVAGNNAFGANVLTTNPNLRDVNAYFFGLNDLFKSIISFRPRHAFVGAGLLWRQYLGNCCDTAMWWFELSTAIVNTRNDMNLEEKILIPATINQTDPAGTASVTETFAGKKTLINTPSPVVNVHFTKGKIDGKQQTTHLDDFEIKLGADLCVCQTGHVEGYVGLIAPVGNRPTAEYVFAPAVGLGHFGFQFGSALGLDVWCCNETTLRFELEQNSRYYLKNTQERSFDLKGKPWSRYMLYSASFGTFSDINSGINSIFTKEMEITPRFHHTIHPALVTSWCNTDFEIGWNWWSRQAEKVTLKESWPDQPLSLNGRSENFSRAVTIKEIFDENSDASVNSEESYDRLSFKESDLDLNSAAHPCAMSQTVYATVGCHIDGCKLPALVGVGASYEFSGVNTAINQWMVWLKLGVSF